jgi:hypothetical protein
MFNLNYRPRLRFAENPPAPAPVPAPAAPPAEPVKLPDDHPLVTALAKQKTELAALKQERDDAKKALDDLGNNQKTEAQKQQDRIDKLDAELKTLAADKLRAEVAAAKGVPVALLSGSTQADLEASADALITFKGTPGSPLGGNQQPAGPVAPVQETQESREDRRKRLEALKR